MLTFLSLEDADGVVRSTVLLVVPRAAHETCVGQATVRQTVTTRTHAATLYNTTTHTVYITSFVSFHVNIYVQCMKYIYILKLYWY